jgi:hypothetical protein
MWWAYLSILTILIIAVILITWFSVQEGFQTVAPSVRQITLPTDAKDTGDIQLGYVGRYVRLMPSVTGDKFMNISQVIIKDTKGNNLGMKPGVLVTSSSTNPGALPASSVVNGKLTVNPWSDLWHSLDDPNEFLLIDLGSEQYLATIRILGRADSNNRLAGLRIQISEEDPNILDVMNPGPKDIIKITFNKNISNYALTKYGNAATAREKLVSQYNDLEKEMGAQYDPTVVAAWSSDPTKESCLELKKLGDMFITRLKETQKQIKDLSGTLDVAGDIRDQNAEYQNLLANKCKGQLTTDCISLALQDAPMFSLLAKYDTASTDLYSNEYDISDNLQTVIDTYKILNCPLDPAMVLPTDTSIGMVDTEVLTSKLQTLSPYYISPDIMKNIVGSIVPTSNIKDKLQYSSDQLVNIGHIIQNIKTLTNTT